MPWCQKLSICKTKFTATSYSAWSSQWPLPNVEKMTFGLSKWNFPIITCWSSPKDFHCLRAFEKPLTTQKQREENLCSIHHNWKAQIVSRSSRHKMIIIRTQHKISSITSLPLPLLYTPFIWLNIHDPNWLCWRGKC
jgi:hypothetical protein